MSEDRPMHRLCVNTFTFPRRLLALIAVAAPFGTASAQSSTDEVAALSLADSALAAITREDHRGLADLFIEGGTLVAMPSGGGQPRVTTRSQVLANPMQGDFVERGWDGEVEVAGAVATVWLPYDFYRDGSWSHCGVDVFTLVRTPGGWQIASLAYTVEQPPTCDPHPDGPPGR